MENAAIARNGYTQATRHIKTARGIEYDAFARVTSRLRAAMPPADNPPALVAALHENRSLWTILAAEVADPANALPVRLRAQIFYLAEFTFAQTSRILSGSGAAGILVEINSSMMGGLRGGSIAA